MSCVNYEKEKASLFVWDGRKMTPACCTKEDRPESCSENGKNNKIRVNKFTSK